MRPAHLLPTLALFADLARRALSSEPIEDAPQHVAQSLRPPRRLGVVRRHLEQRAEARREQEWADAVSRLLQGAEDAAGAVAGHVDAVVVGSGEEA